MLGPTAAAVQTRRIHIEACPSSNVHTGAVAGLAAHPAAMLTALGFSLSVHADNRTASNTSATGEAAAMVDVHRWGVDQLEIAAVAALDAAFCDPETAGQLIDDIVIPGHDTLRHTLATPTR